MPYIPPQDRSQAFLTPRNAGELNFAISSLIDAYIEFSRGGLRYETINEVVGVLECAKLELYRRLAAPYEDRKLKENGDVYATR